MTASRVRLTLRGVTLADLLVSLAVLALVTSAATTLLAAGERTYAAGSARVEAQQAARIAIERMAREIRQAGTGVAPTALAAAERSRIVLNFDANGDGVIAGAGETVTWRLSAGVLRRDAGGGAQPIVNGMRRLDLAYFDVDGKPTTVAADVRAVAITMTLEPERRAAALAAQGAVTVATYVRLRNR